MIIFTTKVVVFYYLLYICMFLIIVYIYIYNLYIDKTIFYITLKIINYDDNIIINI